MHRIIVRCNKSSQTIVKQLEPTRENQFKMIACLVRMIGRASRELKQTIEQSEVERALQQKSFSCALGTITLDMG